MLLMSPRLEYEQGENCTQYRSHDYPNGNPVFQRLDMRSEQIPKMGEIHGNDDDLDPLNHRLYLGDHRHVLGHAYLHDPRSLGI